MKKLLAVLLALTFVLSIGAISFAADAEVSGTLADGTVISKAAAEFVKGADSISDLEQSDAAKFAELKAFFDAAATNPRVVAKGVVDFGGFFNDVTEAKVDVPLAVPEAKADDSFVVTLSSGGANSVKCAEDGVVVAPFPKDAANVGFTVSSLEYTQELPAEKEEVPGWIWTFEDDEEAGTHAAHGKGPNGETVEESWDDEGNYSYEYNDPVNGIKVTEQEDKDGYTYEYSNEQTGEQRSSSAKYDEDGNVTERTSSGNYTTADGTKISYENETTTDENGNTTETTSTTQESPDGKTWQFDNKTVTNAEGTVVEETHSGHSYLNETGEPIDYEDSYKVNDDGSTTTTHSDTVTRDDGSVEAHEESTTTDAEGNVIDSHFKDTGTDDLGNPFTYEESYKKNDDGSSVATRNNKWVGEDGSDQSYSITTTTNPDGSYKTEETYTDGTTEVHYYDKDGNPIDAPDSPSTEG